MTTITIGRDKNVYQIEAKGHAEGKPEVCACISYTMYSLLGYLENTPLKILLKEMDDGFTRIEWEDENNEIYEYIYFSLMQLSANFPKQVKIKSDFIHFFDNK